MPRGEPKLEIQAEPAWRPRERPSLGGAMAACLLFGGAFVGCAAGPAWTGVHEAERPISPARQAELARENAETLGREARDTIGYERLMELAEQAGFVARKPVAEIARADKALLGTAASAAQVFVRVFTKAAFTAGITSQMDTPAPGPADVVALGILVGGLVQAGVLAIEEIQKGQPAPVPTTAPPPPPPVAATATPSAVPTTTVVVPPIAVPRKRPGQTCTDDRLRELEKQSKAACLKPRACPEDITKINAEQAKLYTCPEILARLALGQACHAAREQVQKECYNNAPDSGHVKAIEDAKVCFERCALGASKLNCF